MEIDTHISEPIAENSPVFCHCLYFTSNLLARQLNRLADEVFQPTGLAPSHAFLLMLVVRKPGIMQKGIAEEMGLKASTITRFIDKLSDRGWVRREGAGKITRIFPTEAGIQHEASLKSAWNQLGTKYRELLGNEHAAALTHLTLLATRSIEQ